MDDVTFFQTMRGQVNPGLLIDRNIMNGDQPVIEMASDPQDMRDNYPLLYGIVRGMRAQRVLEIGVHDGTSTIALLKAVAEVGGHLTSIDEADVPVARALADKFGTSWYWTLVKANSHVCLKEMHAAGATFEAVLVDADHSLEGAKQDIADVEKMLVPGGVLFTHDNLMMADGINNEKPFGQRAHAACGVYGREMVIGETCWSGLFLPFNCNLGIWRRRADMIAESNAKLAYARGKGWLP